MYNEETSKAKARRGFAFVLLTVLICALALFPSAFPGHAAYADQTQPRARVINVAYDDSGSMDNGKKAWCQAHYALEVFANMLGENDVLNVFTMSDAEAGKTVPCLTIYGSDSAQNRVDQAHAIFSARNSSTPYDVVINAKNHLDVQDPEAEHWLVVLTDGAFVEYQGKELYISNSMIRTVSADQVSSGTGTLKVTGDVNVRSGPDTTYDILGIARTGDTLTATGLVDGKWYRVSYNGKDGYVNRNYVSVQDFSLVSDQTSKVEIVSKANIRSGPGTSYTILGVADVGATLTVTGYTGSNWYEVNYNGETGYVAGNLVKSVG